MSCLESGFCTTGSQGPWEIFKQESDMIISSQIFFIMIKNSDSNVEDSREQGPTGCVKTC